MGVVGDLARLGEDLMDADDPMTITGRRRAASARVRYRAAGPSLSYEELFHFLVDHIEEYAIFCVDPGGLVASWNPGAARLFGYDEAEILGQPVALLFTPEDQEAGVPEQEMRIAERESRARDERWHLCKDGSRFWGSGIISSLRDPSGQLCGFAKVCRDRTETKRAEEEQQRLVTREREACEHAERASRLKDEFLATVSHELRTPLNAILGWADILSTQQLDAQAIAHALEVIRRNAKAQKQLIEDLLDVSRIITGKLRLEPRPLEVEPVVRAAVDAVRPAAHAKAIKLRERLAPDSGWVLGDADRLQQIFWNLLSNAVKFTPKGGQVAVQLRRCESSVELAITDTGKGIQPEFVPSLFERFRQADASTSRAHAGLGLGLALARHLTELHGGTIRAESAGEGKGSTFTVTLPMSPLQTEPQELEPPRERVAWDQEFAESLLSFDGLRVLVVDDEQDSREFLAFMLRQRGAAVSMARSAMEALELVISDIGMPYEDGYTLIRKVRALPVERGGRTPAVALTAYAREQDRIRALVAGFQSHVVKPVKPAELVVVVAQLAGRLAERTQ
jgi:PAS domain S-box-containing protein